MMITYQNPGVFLVNIICSMREGKVQTAGKYLFPVSGLRKWYNNFSNKMKYAYLHCGMSKPCLFL